MSKFELATKASKQKEQIFILFFFFTFFISNVCEMTSCIAKYVAKANGMLEFDMMSI